MENMQKEQAEYILPRGETAPLLEQIVGAYNAYLNTLFKKTQEAVRNSLLKHKGNINVEWTAVVCEEMRRLIDLEAGNDFAFDMLSESIFGNFALPPSLPDEEDLWLIKLPNDFVHIEFNDAIMELDVAQERISWKIPEGPNAVAEAHNLPFFQVARKALDEMEWSMTSGGKCEGSDIPLNADEDDRDYSNIFGIFKTNVSVTGQPLQ
ncbi:hypothetical protein [Neptuniibacter sp. QD37_11]|uniref:hypothetical protein n=1 Tax=Neptuniibacter sp. QD37_11 TaxID=3398209 RepID=UPI0039F4C358